jgi:hypothetical protein
MAGRDEDGATIGEDKVDDILASSRSKEYT